MSSSKRKMHPNLVQLNFRKLVNYVAQGFYTDDYVTVLDMIVSVEYITFNEADPLHYRNVLNGRLRTRSERWMKALVKTLFMQHMISKDVYQKQEYYYISFDYFINTLRYRISLLEENMRKVQKSPSDLKNKYICSNRCCDQNNDLIIYTTESIASIGNLICPECTRKGRHGDIQQCELTKTNTRQIGLVKKVQNQLKPILELLNLLNGQSWNKLSPYEVKMNEAEDLLEKEEEDKRKMQYGGGNESDRNPSGSTNSPNRQKLVGNSEQQQLFQKIGNDGYKLNVKIAQVSDDWNWEEDTNKKRKLNDGSSNNNNNNNDKMRSEMPDFMKRSSITGRQIVRENDITSDNIINQKNSNDDDSNASSNTINNAKNNEDITNNDSVSMAQAEEFFKHDQVNNEIVEEIEEDEDEEDDSSDDDF